jgi:deoxyribodipyrimidine photo-lyase
MKEKLTIYWSRRDFRLNDNLALSKALQYSKEKKSLFCPLFILENYMLKAEVGFQFGYPSRYFLSKAIPEFAKKFEKFLILKGKAAETILELQKKFDIKVFVNEDIYIDFYKQIDILKKNNVEIDVCIDQMTVNKNIKSTTGNFYSVFTPFKKAVWSEFLTANILPKVNLKDVLYITENILKKIPDKVRLEDNDIIKLFSKNRELYAGSDKYDIDTLFDFKPDFENLENFYTSEDKALELFTNYLQNDLEQYKTNRDSLEKDKTSKMSLGLAWGLVSARSLTQMVQKHFNDNFQNINWYDIKEENLGAIHFLSELIWREFYKYLLYHNPKLMNEEFQDKFRGKVQWVDEPIAKERFTAWMRGETGYRVVDAAMLQLAKSGWMHNRARMIVASVITKNLGVDWRWGQEYFRAMLLDLDEASNCGGWQWGASVGADPKPIRIFNPYLQAENYDSKGVYQKKWLGEERFKSDMEPIVSHKDAREEALRRYGLDKTTDGLPRDY